MSVHPSIGNFDNTLANGILWHWNRNGESHKFHAVNRIDKDTSGVCVIAKNQFSHGVLSEQIKNGDLGNIISVETQMNCNHSKEVREWLGNFPGGMMFFLGCHLTDLILSIQGIPKKIIPLNKCSGVDGVSAKDFGMAIFEYDNGISFAKTSAVEIGGFERRQLVVSGTKKTVELKPIEWYAGNSFISEKYVREVTTWDREAKKEQSAGYDRYDSMMRSFGEMVRGKKENPWNYDYELELFKTILKTCNI